MHPAQPTRIGALDYGRSSYHSTSVPLLGLNQPKRHLVHAVRLAHNGHGGLVHDLLLGHFGGGHSEVGVADLATGSGEGLLPELEIGHGGGHAVDGGAEGGAVLVVGVDARVDDRQGGQEAC